MATQCPKCYTENPSDSKYCKECATSLPSVEGAQVSFTKTLLTPVEDLAQVQDLMRSIDYLETRPDINPHKLAYFGFSWGAWTAPIFLAVEERFKTGILLVGGLWDRERPEVRPMNYITRVKIPILMLNGKYDIFYTLENFVKPMYDLLGTPEEDKKLIVYETDHFVPLNDLIRETLAWLDRFLGPVNR